MKTMFEKRLLYKNAAYLKIDHSLVICAVIHRSINGVTDKTVKCLYVNIISCDVLHYYCDSVAQLFLIYFVWFFCINYNKVSF